MHVSGRWEETEEPGVSPHRHGENKNSTRTIIRDQDRTGFNMIEKKISFERNNSQIHHTSQYRANEMVN